VFRFVFVTIIPLAFWAIVLLLLFMWAAFGLGGMVITVAILTNSRKTPEGIVLATTDAPSFAMEALQYPS
jgi:hypothetical protein